MARSPFVTETVGTRGPDGPGDDALLRTGADSDLVGCRVGVLPAHLEYESGLQLPQVEHRSQVPHFGTGQAIPGKEVGQRLAAFQRIGGLDGLASGIGGGNACRGTRRRTISKPELASAHGERQYDHG